MFPRAARIVTAEDAVVVHSNDRAVTSRPDGVQVDFVTERRFVSLVELRSMRKRDDATAVAIFRLHAVPQVVGLGP